MTRSREVSKGATRVEFVYTATAAQTSFSGNDANSNSLAYTVGQIDVFLNGVRLSAADYTATNGTAVVLGAGAEVGDTLNINAFGTFSVADTLVARTEFDYTATAGQTTFTGSDNDGGTLAYTAGRIDVYLNGSHLNQTDDYVATNGTSVVLQSGATVGDILHIVNHGNVNLISNVAGSAIDMNGLELILDVDADTSITADTDDQIDIKIANADDFRFTANKFDVLSGSTLEVNGTLDANGTEVILDADGDTSITADTDDQIDIKVGGTDLAKLTDGQLTLTSATASRPGILLESTNADANPPFLRFQKNGSSPADNDEVGVIQFYADDDGGNVFVPAQIKVLTSDVTNGSEDGIITIFTTGGGTLAERLRIGSTGEILLGKTSNGFTVAGGCYNDTGAKNGSLELIMDGGVALALNRLSDNGSTVTFHQDSTGVGSIGVTGSNTSFNTSSDYRLKENVDYSWDATTRLKQLKPARFNFIKDDTNTLQDGFLAHEVSSIVPEAITGAKDATIDIDVVKNASGKIISCTTMDTSEQAWIEGKDDEIFPSDSTWHENETVPDYQNIDHSKLVPLLVKTIQELEARIKTLEDA
jgi:hypothetical protein